MKRTITATYRGGVFYPDVPCDLPEGSTVEIRELANGVRPPWRLTLRRENGSSRLWLTV